MLDSSTHSIQETLEDLKRLANSEQKLLLIEWAQDNDLN